MERLAPKNVLRGQYLRKLNLPTIEIPGYTGENERRCYLADKAFQQRSVFLQIEKTVTIPPQSNMPQRFVIIDDELFENLFGISGTATDPSDNPSVANYDVRVTLPRDCLAILRRIQVSPQSD